jgi:hypothetical protein
MLRAMKSVSFFDDPVYISHYKLKFYDAFFRNVLYNVSRSAVTVKLKDMDGEILRALSDNIHGTLIVCATPEGAEDLRNLLRKHSLEDATRVFWGVGPDSTDTANAILLAPRWEQMVSCCFSNIFLYDGNENARFPGEQSTFVPEEAEYDGLLAPLRISREGMGRIYLAFVEQLKNGNMPRAVLLSKVVGQSTETAMMALLTFIELDFFHWDAATDTIQAAKAKQQRSLLESSVYVSANLITHTNGALA